MSPAVENEAGEGVDPPALRCREIRVGQALGIRQGDGFSVTGFSPGITLVLAPNGTGKSTMARALALLAQGGSKEAWRQLVGDGDASDESYRRLDVSASFDAVVRVGGGPPIQRNVSVLGGHVQEHQDGREYRSPPPDLAIASRYFISLPDLLVDEGVGFSRLIFDQASGGIRWSRIGLSLGWSEEPSRPRSLVNRVKDARKAREDAIKAQSELEERASALPGLRTERQELWRRIDRDRALNRVHSRRKLEAKAAELQVKLDGVHENLRRLSGTERAKLGRLSLKIDNAGDVVARCKSDLKNIESKAPAPLTDQERQARIDAVEGLVSALEARQSERIAASSLHVSASARLLEAEAQLSALDAAAPPVTPGDVPIDSILEAGKAVSRAAWQSGAKSEVVGELRRKITAMEQRWSIVQGAAAASAEDVTDALRLLSNWLRQQRAEDAPAPASVPALVLIAMALVALAFVGSLIGALAGSIAAMATVALSAAALVFLSVWCIGRRAARSPAPSRPQDGSRTEYERLSRMVSGIPMPSEWAVEPVLEVHARLAKSAAFIERALLLEDLRARLRELERSSGVAEAALEEAKATIEGFVGRRNVGIDPLWASSIAGLCADWLRARQSFSSAGAVLESANDEFVTASERAKKALSDAGCIARGSAEALGAESARALFDSLKSRIDSRLLYERETREPAESRLTLAQSSLSAAQNEFQQFLSGIPGSPGTKESLERILEEWDSYRKVVDDHSRCMDELKEYAGDHPEEDDVREMSDAAIVAELEAIPALKHDVKELERKIAEIEQQVRDAGSGQSVSGCLRDLAAANLELRNREIADVDTAIGRAVFGWARREAQTAMAPRVLRRACEMTTKFTSGRLQFEVNALDQHEDAVFRARNAAEPWRPISQLSSGERVQLLLAVRLAFLQEGESMRLPIILDEALASSDDDRAGRVMDAVVDVAKSGRQVLYLSSQAEEIEKWTAKIQGAGVDFRVIRLADVRGIESVHARPSRQALPPGRALPAPDGCTREEYAELIGVPGINWFDEQLDALHLWYVLSDLSELHRQVSAGVESLGQLERLATQAGDVLARGALEQARPWVMGFRAAASEWRMGRGRPMGPEVLEECDAISTAFRDRVSECLGKSSGDARVFLDLVANLKGFRESSAVRLEQWLHSRGHLVDAPRRTHDEIRNAVLVAVRDAGAAEPNIGGIVAEVMAQMPA